MKFRLATVLLALGTIISTLPRAQAGPPYITDDPEPVEYQHWEFYVASLTLMLKAIGLAPRRISKSTMASCPTCSSM